jgi:hypothetical protein
MALEDLLRASLPTRIEGVVERMRAIEEALPARDGARVHAALPRGDGGGGRARPSRRVCIGPKRPPRAWSALFEARSREGIAPIQVVLAGMNAHGNRDLR